MGSRLGERKGLRLRKSRILTPSDHGGEFTQILDSSLSLQLEMSPKSCISEWNLWGETEEYTSD